MIVHQYLVYDVTGKCRVESTEKPASLEQLQSWVGGYIEMTPFGQFTLCVDEEGLLKKLPVNKEYPWLVGTVVVGCRKGEEFIGASRSKR